MFSRIASRASPASLTLCRDSLLALARRNQSLINASAAPVLFGLYHSFATSSSKGIWKQEARLNQMHRNRFPFQHCNMSSSTASAEFNDKETVRSGNEHDTDSRSKLSRDELLTLLREKDEELKMKHEEFQKMQYRSLRNYAEVQDYVLRTKREAENLEKYPIQDFAKRLLAVADNLERATSVVKKDLSKIEEFKDDAALQLLKTLMQGIEMTEKQLTEVFKKFGVVKYDALNEEFDPYKHNVVFQAPDSSKRPGTVAHVLKSGYMLHDRIIRPAAVGVAQSLEEEFCSLK